MRDSRVLTASVVGAVIGGVAGYLFFTEEGRRLRRRIEPALDDFARELISLRGTVSKAAGAASESWKLLNDALGESGQAAARYPGPRQTSPF
jgi:gas vesicle protein